MHLTWIDYGVLVLLLILSGGIGIYQGCSRRKHMSAKEFLVADGQMKILPTAMSLLASLTSAVSLLGVPVEIYYYGTMMIYVVFSWYIATYVTMKFFIPKIHSIGSMSIYAYLEKRFSLAIRVLVTCSYIFVSILYMAIVLYAPSLALSQVTGLNIWISICSCGLVCTIYTSIGGMKAVIWTDVIQGSIMFLGVILSIIFGLIDVGGISNVIDKIKTGNRLQLTVATFDPSVRYTIWSVVIGNTFSSIAQYACIQTQAQRYLCVKDAKTAQRVAWLNYLMTLSMQILCIFVGCLLYAKYNQCDPLSAKIISRADQLYPLFVIETLGRIPGFTGLFISCVLSATLSTFSSGVNSMATVSIEDIYKRLSAKQSHSDEKQLFLSKVLSFIFGLATIIIAFAVSFLQSNIITIIIQIFGAFAAPILGTYLLGLLSSRIKSRSVIVAFCVCLFFQIFMLVGSIFSVKPIHKTGGRLPISIDSCVSSFNTTAQPKPNIKSNLLVSLFSISPLWFIFNGTLIMIVFGFVFSVILDSKDSKIVDRSLLITRNDIFSCCPSKDVTRKVDEIAAIEQESML